MFETLQSGFSKARKRLRGEVEIDEKVLDASLRDIKLSLLEADVDLKITRSFLERLKEKSMGEVVRISAKNKAGKKVKITAADAFVKICQDELTDMMGPVDTELQMAGGNVPTGVMMVGLNGVGKTTTTGKLGRLLETQGHTPLLCAADTYRPAAIEQLQVLGQRLNLPVYADFDTADPVAICNAAMRRARELNCDVVLFDTAGRQTVDDRLMQQLQDIKTEVKPKNIFLVNDAMIGQDAVTTAREFHARLSITGVILTKLDGDARGGAALSIKEATGAPIKYIGMGEGMDKLEAFRPDGLASRILGMGDVVGLVNDFEQVVDAEKAEKDAMRMLKGQFTMFDFLEQMQMLKKMGSLGDLVEKLPFFQDGMPDQLKNLDERELVKTEAMIQSMTRQERIDVSLFTKQPSRVTRVARGSGRSEKEVTELITRFNGIQQMMGSIGKQAGMLSKIPGMKQLAMAKQMKNAMGGGGVPGMPGMPGMDDFSAEMLQSAVAGASSSPRKNMSAASRTQNKNKRKQARKARKKTRKKK